MTAAGLEGVIAAESAISAIVDNQLLYRGIPVETAVEQGRFAEIAWLLWQGKLPTSGQLTRLEDELAAAGDLPRDVVARLAHSPA